jgi:hypothetical protein
VNRHDRALRRLVHEFLDEGRRFEDFHEGFIAQWTRLPARALTPAARSRWNDIYGLVLIALPDPVGEEDTARGAIGEAELRRRLRRHPLLAGAPEPG